MATNGDLELATHTAPESRRQSPVHGPRTAFSALTRARRVRGPLQPASASPGPWSTVPLGSDRNDSPDHRSRSGRRSTNRRPWRADPRVPTRRLSCRDEVLGTHWHSPHRQDRHQILGTDKFPAPTSRAYKLVYNIAGEGRRVCRRLRRRSPSLPGRRTPTRRLPALSGPGGTGAG